jgi:hypothetical protein
MTDIDRKVVEPTLEIGGYFGLDLPDFGDPFPDPFIKFQSGRSALRAVLECAGIKRIMLPAYICDSVIQTVIDTGVVVETYRLDDSLYPKGLPDLFPKKCAFLYVNYFGLCEANVSRLLRNIPSNQLIIDNTHALFERPVNALATIYSPRKFVGVPDGGLLVTSGLEIKVPEHEDTDSLGRMRPLLLRMAYTAQDGYSDKLESENTLYNSKPLKMSRLTKRILASIDMTMVKRQRRENFLALAARLDKYNSHKWDLNCKSVPLCYPLIVGWDVQQLKRKLVGKGIYISTYWPDANPRVSDGVELRLINSCLPVPCDQRYSLDQMSYLADVIVSSLDIK